MEYGTKSDPAPTMSDSHYHSRVTWSEHDAAEAIGQGNLNLQVGFDDISRDKLGELTRTFDQMVAILLRVTAGRDQLEKEVAERHLVEAILKQNLEELSRTNQQLEEFAYVASHDLQEPLRKIQKFCQMLEIDMGTALPEAARKDLALITDGASRMQQLILGVLTFLRLGRDGVKFAPLSLEQVVDWALANLAVSIEEKQAHIERDALPEVTGDSVLLVELYQNLIGNALKYNDARPEIRITAARDDGRWVLGVQDNGIGINPAYAEQIFVPFMRLHGRDRYHGTGLGLAICRRVTEIHDGAIWVESSEGRGAHFRFTLTASLPV
jgi:light-regulated signal transduction histidine kinase (bacteriophytochrome)